MWNVCLQRLQKRTLAGRQPNLKGIRDIVELMLSSSARFRLMGGEKYTLADGTFVCAFSVFFFASLFVCLSQ